MKKLFLLIILIVAFFNGSTQVWSVTKSDTTSKLPEGIQVKNGQIKVLQGYKALFSEKDNKVIVIQRVSGNRTSRGSITGSFTCICKDSKQTNDCSAVIRETAIYCTGEKCKDCALYVTIKPAAGMSITRETKGEIWKKFIYGNKSQ